MLRRALAVSALCLAAGCADPPVVPAIKALELRAPAPRAAWEPPRLDAGRRAHFDRLVPRLDEMLAAAQKESHAPGLAASIVLGGEIVYAKGFGLRDVDRKLPFEVDTPFSIASVTKGFTAMAILSLRDAGKLDLEMPAENYYPPMGKVVAPTRDAPPITVRHLLTHSSGLPEDNLWADVTENLSEADLTRLLDGAEASRVPGIRFEYSNVGWAVLGRIVEKVSGEPYEAFVRRAVLEPLGMLQSGFRVEDFPANTVSVGYRGRAGDDDPTAPRESAPFERLGVMNAAGGLITSARELARYVSFQVGAWPPRDDAEAGPLRRSSVREMQQAMRGRNYHEYLGILANRNDSFLAGSADGKTRFRAPAYGFGLVNDVTCEEDFQVGHGGGLPGYQTEMTMLPEKGFGIVVLLNDSRAWSPAIEEVTALLREEGLLEAPKVTPTAALAAAPAAFEALAVRWDDERARSLFEPSFFRYQSLEALKSKFEKLGRDHGACHLEGAPDFVNRLRGRWRVACTRGSIRIAVAVAPGPKARLQGMTVRSNLPPTPALDRAARALAILLNRWDASAAAATLAKRGDAAAVSASFARTGVLHGPCKLGEVVESDGARSAVFELGCRERRLELSIGVDDAGRVTFVDAKPARTSPNCAD